MENISYNTKYFNAIGLGQAISQHNLEELKVMKCVDKKWNTLLTYFEISNSFRTTINRSKIFLEKIDLMFNKHKDNFPVLVGQKNKHEEVEKALKKFNNLNQIFKTLKFSCEINEATQTCRLSTHLEKEIDSLEKEFLQNAIFFPALLLGFLKKHQKQGSIFKALELLIKAKDVFPQNFAPIVFSWIKVLVVKENYDEIENYFLKNSNHTWMLEYIFDLLLINKKQDEATEIFLKFHHLMKNLEIDVIKKLEVNVNNYSLYISLMNKCNFNVLAEKKLELYTEISKKIAHSYYENTSFSGNKVEKFLLDCPFITKIYERYLENNQEKKLREFFKALLPNKYKGGFQYEIDSGSIKKPVSIIISKASKDFQRKAEDLQKKYKELLVNENIDLQLIQDKILLLRKFLKRVENVSKTIGNYLKAKQELEWIEKGEGEPFRALKEKRDRFSKLESDFHLHLKQDSLEMAINTVFRMRQEGYKIGKITTFIEVLCKTKSSDEVVNFLFNNKKLINKDLLTVFIKKISALNLQEDAFELYVKIIEEIFTENLIKRTLEFHKLKIEVETMIKEETIFIDDVIQYFLKKSQPEKLEKFIKNLAGNSSIFVNIVSAHLEEKTKKAVENFIYVKIIENACKIL